MVLTAAGRHQESQVDELAKQVAEVAHRLAALPPDGVRDAQALDTIEQLALRILNEVSAARRKKNRPVGESSGLWRAVQPLRP